MQERGTGLSHKIAFFQLLREEEDNLELREQFLTQNDCYKGGRTIVPKGIMVHSLGVAQPNVGVFLSTWNAPGITKCVHAFVAEGGIVQTLPWNYRAWHAGTPKKSGISANSTHISFEICEPAGHTYAGGTMLGYDIEKNAAYFASVYQSAVELCAMLCEKFKLDPLRDILCHSEGYTRNMATNHADVMHWFPKHGKNMNIFRADVQKMMQTGGEEEMTREEFHALFTAELGLMQDATQAKPASPWAQETWDKAKASGLFDGTKPQDALTREQAAVVFERLSLLETAKK